MGTFRRHVDWNVKELNQKTYLVTYCKDIDDGYYVSVMDYMMYVKFQRFYVP